MQSIVIQSPDAAPVVSEFAPVVVEAAELVVGTKGEHASALEIIRRLRLAQRKIQELFSQPKTDAFRAHKSICAAESKLLIPYVEAERIVSSKCTGYEREQRRIAEEAERHAREDARRREEELRFQEALEAENAGEAAEAQAILDQPIAVPTVRVEPEVAKVEGISQRVLWSAEVNDLVALVGYVAAHPEWISLVEPNATALNALARAQRGELRIPGVKAVSTISRAVRA